MKTSTAIGKNLAIVLLSILAVAPSPRAAEEEGVEKGKAHEQRERAHRQRELEEKEHEEEHNYRRGVRQLDKREWEDAVKYFDRVVAAKGNRADGAYYWKAYAEFKRGERDKALAALSELKKSYPQSRWLDDAKALEIEIREADGQATNPDKEVDEELKLMALNGLVHSDSEKALPLLKKLLEGSQPRKVKERALFVLSQSKSPEAGKIVAEVARGKSNPDLERKALEYVALFGGKESKQVLADVYASSQDVKIKRDILRFFMIGGDKERLLKAAKEESSPELRREAIAQLCALKAQKELAELYQTEKAPELKKKILDSMFAARNTEKLIELAQKETDPDLRRRAVEKLGVMNPEKTGQALLSLYANEKDKAVRKAIIEGLFVQDNAKALIEIARKETDPELKKKIVEQLATMKKSKEAADFLMELLNK